MTSQQSYSGCSQVGDITGHNKRSAEATVVSPDAKQAAHIQVVQAQLASKKHASEYIMKTEYPLKEDKAPVLLIGSNPELFLVHLKGGLELIYCNQGQDEGFVHSFVDVYFNGNNAQNFSHLHVDTGIIAMVARCKSREEDVPQCKVQDGKMTAFQKSYSVCMSGPNGGSDDSQMRALVAIK